MRKKKKVKKKWKSCDLFLSLYFFVSLVCTAKEKKRKKERRKHPSISILTRHIPSIQSNKPDNQTVTLKSVSQSVSQSVSKSVSGI